MNNGPIIIQSSRVNPNPANKIEFEMLDKSIEDIDIKQHKLATSPPSYNKIYMSVKSNDE